MSKTFEHVVRDVTASVRVETAGTLASRSGIAWAVLARHARAALAIGTGMLPPDDLVSRIVDAVRVELAAEEAAPVEPLMCALRGIRAIECDVCIAVGGPVPTWSSEPHWTEEERDCLWAGEPDHGPYVDRLSRKEGTS